MNALEISGLTKRFGRRTAVDGLTLSVEAGDSLALLGMNGAGKTTLLRLLAGLIGADAGSVRVMGFPAGSAQARSALGLAPQESAVSENLTVRENLELMAAVCGADARAVDAQLYALSLREMENRRAKHLSGGWRRRLSLAMALVGTPRVLLLDEPTLGLDVPSRRELWSLVRALRGQTTLLLATNDMAEAEALARRSAILVQGRLAALGTPEELMSKAAADCFEDAFLHLAEREAVHP